MRSNPWKFFLVPSLLVIAAGTWLLAARAGIPWYLGALLLVNVLTFIHFGYDKLAARQGTWLRVPERVLHVLAFAGGTPAAYLGQQVFRHKTVKKSFRLVFFLLLCLQLGLVAFAIWYRSRT